MVNVPEELDLGDDVLDRVLLEAGLLVHVLHGEHLLHLDGLALHQADLKFDSILGPALFLPLRSQMLGYC